MTDTPNSLSDPAGDPGLALCAWLDRELAPQDSAEFEQQLERNAELRRTAEDFKRMDALLKDWYQNATELDVAPAVRKPVTAARSVRRWPLRAAVAVAAAAILAVVVVLPAMQGRRAAILAEDAITSTGSAALKAKGMLATFDAKIVQHHSKPDDNTGTVETRTATGEIKYGPLFDPRLNFRCTEKWAAMADEPELTRDWAQTPEEQWFTEKQGNSVISNSLTLAFDPASGANAAAALNTYRADGSPVDVRTRQAVEGLAVLVRSFSRDTFLKWMGLTWQFKGGLGTAASPWVYTTQPHAATDATLVWTLSVYTGSNHLIEGLDLDEAVSDAASGAPQSSIHIAYILSLRDEPWADDEFERVKAKTNF